jgi:hypothetical protein
MPSKKGKTNPQISKRFILKLKMENGNFCVCDAFRYFPKGVHINERGEKILFYDHSHKSKSKNKKGN